MISEAREATSADIEAQEAASPARIMMRGTRGRASTEAQESSSQSSPWQKRPHPHRGARVPVMISTAQEAASAPRRRSPRQWSARRMRPQCHQQAFRRRSPRQRPAGHKSPRRQTPRHLHAVFSQNKEGARVLLNDHGHIRARFTALGDAIGICTDSRCAIVGTYSRPEKKEKVSMMISDA